ncbi:MAG: hypothetical protein Q9187_006821 [Circinaria calcarea]
MSHFISSFLVEPVVRQARRFSRPSISNESARREESPSLHGHGHSDNSDAMASPQEIEHQVLDFENDPSFQDPSISGQPVVLSPTSEIGGLEAELQALQRLQSSSSGTLDLQNPNSGRARTNSRLEDGSSSNPLHRIAERFRSANTSHSSSIYSLDNPDMTPVEGSALSRRYTGQESSRRGTGSYNSKMADEMLPADDGMGTMRRRIIEIQKSELPTTDKSRLIHELMTHEYSLSQSSLHASNHARTRSPASLRSQDRPLTPNSGHSICDIGRTTSPPTSQSSATDTDSPIYVSPEDLKPTYYSKPPLSELSRSTETATSDQHRSSTDQEEDKVPLGCAHYRRNRRESVKIALFGALGITAESVSYGTTILRKVSIIATTVEFAGSDKDSAKTFITARSIINMEMQFRQLDQAIESQPMPPQLQDTKAWIYCNDCCAKTSVKYHWLGLKCAVCDSYNTAQIRMLSETNQQTEVGLSDEGLLIPDDVNLLTSDTLRQVPRGRSTHNSDAARRPASSVSALDRIRTIVPSEPLRQTFRSSSPRITTRQSVPESSINTDDADAMETDDDDDLDDVDFWGRQSPRGRARHETGMVETGSADDSDEGDDDDELMDDELEDDDDDGEGEDHMEIFGHR